ncbi:DNA-binding protein [Enterococcus entomosocium]|uniref:DNA-binding protein n=1 Tax=Enterococcus entomosocium TaxID=3034352 RepID=UPI0026495ADC|nr:DNA-binding protein [Enterococcus entomosocium]
MIINLEHNEQHLLSSLIPFIEDYTKTILKINRLPLVLTNDDLKKEFQISDSTLNRLIKLTDFPSCWYGIRGHYSRDQIMSWYKKNDYETFRDKMQLLRSI